MELINITRGHIEIRAFGKEITIYGEGLLRGYDSPDFIIYSNSIIRWDCPNENHEVLEHEKREIIAFLFEEFKSRRMTLVVE